MQIITTWGVSQTKTLIGGSAAYVTTASHGGYIVRKPYAEKHFPGWLLNAGFVGLLDVGWYHYEEDAAYSALELFALNCWKDAEAFNFMHFIEGNRPTSKTLAQYKDDLKSTCGFYYPDILAKLNELEGK